MKYRYADVPRIVLAEPELTKLHRRYLKHRRKEDCERLLQHHYGFAVRTAMRYVRPNFFPESEAISAAVHGMIHALERYSPSKGTFTTFSFWWMLKYILRERAFMKNVVELPVSLVRKERRMRALRVKLGHDDIAVAREMGIDIEELQRLENLHVPHAVPTSDIELRNPYDVSPSEVLEQEERPSMHERMLESMRYQMEQLTPRERELVKARHKAEPETFAALGQRFGITREAARHAYNLALQRLQKLCAKDVKRYYE